MKSCSTESLWQTEEPIFWFCSPSCLGHHGQIRVSHPAAMAARALIIDQGPCSSYRHWQLSAHPLPGHAPTKQSSAKALEELRGRWHIPAVTAAQPYGTTRFRVPSAMARLVRRWLGSLCTALYCTHTVSLHVFQTSTPAPPHCLSFPHCSKVNLIFHLEDSCENRMYGVPRECPSETSVSRQLGKEMASGTGCRQLAVICLSASSMWLCS